MARLHKTVWFEGMTLDPHHFQQWDRYYQASLNGRLRSLMRYDWGFAELNVDREAVVNGQFRLLQCAGITPDGLPFDMPGKDLLPASRSFQEHFPAAAESLGVFLSIPVEQAGGRNCEIPEIQDEGGGGNGGAKKGLSRFTLENIQANDDNTGGDQRPIGVARPNFQLRFSTEPLDSFNVLKVAEIVRSGDGNFRLSERFIPPCLAIGAAENLLKGLGRILELLVAKSAAFSRWRRQLPSGQIRFLTSDFSVLGTLQTINSFAPLVSHHHTGKTSHPEQVFTLMLGLAGQLTTYSSREEVELPAYNHSDLASSFGPLETAIQEILGGITSANYISIVLEKARESLYVGRVADEFLLDEAEFMLLATGQALEANTLEQLPSMVRVASPETVDSLLDSMGQGLPVEAVGQPPAGLPRAEGIYYLGLQKEGPFWAAICRSRAVALWTPPELVNLRFELIAVR